MVLGDPRPGGSPLKYSAPKGMDPWGLLVFEVTGGLPLFRRKHKNSNSPKNMS